MQSPSWLIPNHLVDDIFLGNNQSNVSKNRNTTSKKLIKAQRGVSLITTV
jgi:hypothetical protein